jgi:hypothetical protein
MTTANTEQQCGTRWCAWYPTALGSGSGTVISSESRLIGPQQRILGCSRVLHDTPGTLGYGSLGYSEAIVQGAQGEAYRKQ